MSEVLLNLTLGSDVFSMCGQAGHSLVTGVTANISFKSALATLLQLSTKSRSDPGLQYTQD